MMIRIENHLGVIDISHAFLVELVSKTVSNCFGVAGMAANGPKQDLFSRVLQKNDESQGIRVRYIKGQLVIDLHILVVYGMNVSEVVKSIMNKVRYTVEETTGFCVSKVNVFVEGMNA